VAALGLLVLPSVASAKRHSRDRNHNGIPDKWEKRYHLKGKRLAKADPDKDGLNNKAEWRSHTNPRKADSNRNGVGDASEDPDRDKVDNGNEAREGTNPCKGDSNHNGVKDGKEDADSDALNNAGEDDAGTDPINPDSDDDGVKDGDEKAGEIVSFDGTTLTIRVFGGATVSGTVDDNTWIECGTDSPGADWWWDDSEKVRPREVLPHDEPTGDDPSADDGSTDEGSTDEGSTDDPGADDGSSEDPGAGDESTDEGDEDYGGCATDTLKVGAVITEATLVATPEGLFFDSVEVKAAATP
jgi:hypothetical protein